MVRKQALVTTRRSMMAGTAAALLVGATTASGATSRTKPAVRTYASADFYDGQGKFLIDKAARPTSTCSGDLAIRSRRRWPRGCGSSTLA